MWIEKDERHHVWGLCLGGLMWAASAAAEAQGPLIGVLPATKGGTDYQAYYDPVANLTWMANANMKGAMTWDQAKEWAAHLKINGITGWRLPNAPQPDPTCDTQTGGISRGFKCTGSEMGNLFYNVLGNVDFMDVCAKTHNCNKSEGTFKNRGPFKNLLIDYYWAATEDPTDIDSAMYFDFRFGDQREVNKLFGMYAWAVHSGNVGHAPVPSGTAPKPNKNGVGKASTNAKQEGAARKGQ